MHIKSLVQAIAGRIVPTRYGLSFCFGLLALIAMLWATPDAYAQAAGGGGNAIDNMCPGEGIAARFVPCLRTNITNMAAVFFDQVYPLLSNVITISMLLAVTFFGVMMITNMVPIPQAARETFLLLVKIGAVVLFTSNLPMMYQWALQILDGLIEIVSNFTFSLFGPLRCPAALGTAGIWGRIDCVLNSVIGISEEGHGTLANGIIAFLWSNIFTGAMGLLVFLAGVAMCFNIVLGLFRAISSYLLALIYLSLMITVSLIFIPLVMFKNTAASYFKKWLQITISLILQPVILFAFLNVMITALDVVLFSGPNSLYRTVAGDASQAADFSLSTYLKERDLYTPDEANAMTVDLSQQAHRQVPTADDGRPQGPLSGMPDNPKDPDNTDPAQIPVGFEYMKLDFAKVAAVRQGGPALPEGPPAQAMQEAISSAVLLSVIVTFMLIQVMHKVPELAQDLAGGIKETPDVAGQAQSLPGGRLVSGVTSNVSAQMENLVATRRPSS